MAGLDAKLQDQRERGSWEVPASCFPKSQGSGSLAGGITADLKPTIKLQTCSCCQNSPRENRG